MSLTNRVLPSYECKEMNSYGILMRIHHMHMAFRLYECVNGTVYEINKRHNIQNEFQSICAVARKSKKYKDLEAGFHLKCPSTHITHEWF